MRNGLIGLLALSIAAIATPAAVAQRGEQRRVDAVDNGWLFDFDKGRREARRTGKPMMVVLRCVP